MAIISTKASYGLSAIVILARSQNQLLQIKEIAARGNIPQNYLEQILVILKNNGFVRSVRGANGGYKLIKEIEDIKVYEILKTLDCCVSFVDLNTQTNLLNPFWEDVELKMKEYFSLSIKELLELLDNKSKNIIYYI